MQFVPRALALALVSVGCGRLGFEDARTVTRDAAVDAVDAVDRCAIERLDLGAFGPPVRITELSSANEDDDPVLLRGGLEMIFASRRPGGPGGLADLWTSRRTTLDSAWQPPTVIAEVSSPDNDNTPAIASDGLELWWVSDRPGGLGGEDVWTATRPDLDATWGAPQHVPELSSSVLDRGPAPFLDDLQIMLHSNRPGGLGGTDFYVAARTARGQPWSTPVVVAGLATPSDDLHPWVSPCGLQVFSQRTVPGQGLDFFVARRASLDEPFGAAVHIPELSSAGADQDIHLRSDLREVYFASQSDLFRAVR